MFVDGDIIARVLDDEDIACFDCEFGHQNGAAQDGFHDFVGGTGDVHAIMFYFGVVGGYHFAFHGGKEELCAYGGGRLCGGFVAGRGVVGGECIFVGGLYFHAEQ